MVNRKAFILGLKPHEIVQEYISQKHSNALGGNNSAGPIYNSRVIANDKPQSIVASLRVLLFTGCQLQAEIALM